MKLKPHELQERRAALAGEMRKIADTAEAENRDLTADETKAFDKHKAEIGELDKKIERATTLADIERRAPAVVSRVGDGKYEERAREFSIVTAIRDAIGERVDAGRERELSQELSRRTGRSFQGIGVPDEVFLEKRTLLAGTTAADLVPNIHRGDLFIDRLRNAIVVTRLGATFLSDLVGSPVDIPRMTASSAAQWLAEDASLTETDAAFDDVNLTPKTVGALTSFSRRTLINAVPSVEALVRNDLAQAIANAVDEKAISGDGTGNTPTGILFTAGIGDVPGGTNGLAPSWDNVTKLIDELAIDNALSGGAYLTNSKAVGKMRRTLKTATDTSSNFIQTEPNALAGYPLAMTNAVPSNLTKGTGTNLSALIFGDFAQLLIASWSGVDLLTNPYAETAYAKGRVQVRAMKDVDVAVRHPESFSATKDLITT